MSGLEFEVTSVETRIDSTVKHMKKDEVVAPWPIVSLGE